MDGLKWCFLKRFQDRLFNQSDPIEQENIGDMTAPQKRDLPIADGFFKKSLPTFTKKVFYLTHDTRGRPSRGDPGKFSRGSGFWAPRGVKRFGLKPNENLTSWNSRKLRFFPKFYGRLLF